MRIFILWSLLLLFNLFSFAVKAETGQPSEILVVTSYNPDTQSMSNHLNAFVEEYGLLGGQGRIVVESINCKNLSGLYSWKRTMLEVLSKHFGKEKPALVIMVGQEAWASYLSLEEEWVRELPVMGALVSENAVTIPSETVDLKSWNPVSTNAFNDYPNHHIIGAVTYVYDVKANIDLMLRCFPDMKRVAFVSDNTYGGVAMQALVKKEMKNYPQLELELLDGRVEPFVSIYDRIKKLPEHTCVLIGTWRVDCTENYIVGNSAYMFNDANPTIPAFSISTTGLGQWAIGGYTPYYHNLGYEMADMVYRYLDMGEENVVLDRISGCYRFDMQKLEFFNLEDLEFTENAELINVPVSFFEQYRTLVISIAVFILLLVVLLLGISYYAIRERRLHEVLEASQEQLLIAKNKAEEANRLKSSFLANVSHEIRTPLNAIVGFSEVLTSGEFPLEEQKEFCEIIKKNADSLLMLINDILDISRMESGHVSIVLNEVDVVGLMHDALMTVQESGKTRAVFKQDAPCKVYMLTTDAYRLKQVLINLLGNAAKFTPSGTITLSMKLPDENGWMEFSVTDTGCGIPPEKAEKVFERFEKLNEFAQGTGLGLSISRLIVEKLGGKIWVDATYQEGARFVFTHPVAPQTT